MTSPKSIVIYSDVFPFDVLIETMVIMLHGCGVENVLVDVGNSDIYLRIDLSDKKFANMKSSVDVPDDVGDDRRFQFDSIEQGENIEEVVKEVLACISVEYPGGEVIFNPENGTICFTNPVIHVSELTRVVERVAEPADIRDLREGLSYLKNLFGEDRFEAAFKEVVDSWYNDWCILEYKETIPAEGAEIFHLASRTWTPYYPLPGEVVEMGLFRFKDVPEYIKKLRAHGLEYLTKHHSEDALKKAIPYIEESIKQGYVFIKEGEKIPVGSENFNFLKSAWRPAVHCNKPVVTGLFRHLVVNINHAYTHYLKCNCTLTCAKLDEIVRNKVKEGYRVLAPGEKFGSDNVLTLMCVDLDWSYARTNPNDLVTVGINVVKR